MYDSQIMQMAKAVRYLVKDIGSVFLAALSKITVFEGPLDDVGKGGGAEF